MVRSAMADTLARGRTAPRNCGMRWRGEQQLLVGWRVVKRGIEGRRWVRDEESLVKVVER